MLRIISHTALVIIAVLSLVACLPSVKRPVKKKAPGTTRILLDKGRYEDAARRMSSRNWRKFASPEERVYMYSAAINGFIKRGDASLKKKDCGKAGVWYRKALDYYPSDASISKRIKLSKIKVRMKLTGCSRELMEAGLLKYRAGQLGDAIAIWKSIILFDPKNAEAIKALDTATVQFENLKKLGP